MIQIAVENAIPPPNIDAKVRTESLVLSTTKKIIHTTIKCNNTNKYFTI
jgi:hypothetical protein